MIDKILESYGKHTHKNTCSWMYVLYAYSFKTPKIKKRFATIFSPTKLTSRQKRKCKRGFRSFIKSGKLPHEHEFFKGE